MKDRPGRPWIVIALLASACASPDVPSDPPSLTGEIVDVVRYRPYDDDLPGIHVKESPDDECGILFGIAPETVLVRRTADDGSARIGVEDLGVGQLARVWFDGVQETCPGQSIPTAVEVWGSGILRR